jgi:light-regulated signal transduction histidine kinase (bacteriophytochrome)
MSMRRKIQDQISRMPLRVVTWYLCVGALWILFSDRALVRAVRDPELLTELQSIKGWLFLAITGGLLHLLIRRGLHIISEALEAQRKAEADLKRLYADLEDQVAERTSQYLEANQQLVHEVEQRQQAEEEVSWLNQDLLRQKAELESVNRELEAFSFSVSHDLRAPLRHISGFTHILQQEYGTQLNDAGRDYLARIGRSCDTLATLIHELLELARISRSELHLSPLDLSQAAREVAAELQQGDPARQVVFSIEEGLEAVGDPVLVRLVLTNLLGNAFKYTSRCGAAQIEFQARTFDGRRYFQVRDNGAGFDMRFASKLFAPFQRLHRKEEYEGTGVGLAIVQRIVHRHGGEVRAEGEPERGATFSFTLG